MKDSNIQDLKNEIDDLKLKGGELSQMYFDKQTSQYAVLQTRNKQQESEIKQLKQDLERAVNSLKEFHSKLMRLETVSEQITSKLTEQINQKIKVQNTKIVSMTEKFKEALLLSNKTYFLEEISKQKGIQKHLKQMLGVQEKQITQLNKELVMSRMKL